MTIAEFNALPLEARRFIESNAGCLSCGNKEKKLTKAYELYLNSRKMGAYQMRGGGVNYKEGDTSGVLYNIKADDEPDTIREKIRLAKAIYKKSPELFLSYDEKQIGETLKNLPKATVVDISNKKEGKKELAQENPEAETEEGEL